MTRLRISGLDGLHNLPALGWGSEMTLSLKQPSEYMPWLEAARKTNRYARNWVLRLERHTNRHPECSGRPWGWWEVWPNGIEVGHWGSSGDGLKGVDVEAWNAEAKRISRPNNGRK